MTLAAKHQTITTANTGKQQPFLQRKPTGATDRPFISPQHSPATQPKLTVNQPGDAYEQEADRMADRVMRMPLSTEAPPMISRIHAGAPVQRMCSACAESGSRCNDCAAKEKESKIQRKPENNTPTHSSDAITQRLIQRKGRGNTLPPAVQEEMGQTFQADFNNVRLHTDPEAAAMSSDLNAQAFTYGQDIYFNAGKYEPGTAAGRGVLAHELTHTVQQGGGMDIQRKAEKAKTKDASIEANNCKPKDNNLLCQLKDQIIPNFKTALDELDESKINTIGTEILTVWQVIELIHNQEWGNTAVEEKTSKLAVPAKKQVRRKFSNGSTFIQYAGDYEGAKAEILSSVGAFYYKGFRTLDFMTSLPGFSDVNSFISEQIKSVIFVAIDTKKIIDILQQEFVYFEDEQMAVDLLSNHVVPWEYSFIHHVLTTTDCAFPPGIPLISRFLDFSGENRLKFEQIERAFNLIKYENLSQDAFLFGPIKPLPEKGMVKLLMPLSPAEVSKMLYGDPDLWETYLKLYNPQVFTKDIKRDDWFEAGTELVIDPTFLREEIKTVRAQFMASEAERRNKMPALDITPERLAAVGNTLTIGIKTEPLIFPEFRPLETYQVDYIYHGRPPKGVEKEGRLIDFTPENADDVSPKEEFAAKFPGLLHLALTIKRNHDLAGQNGSDEALDVFFNPSISLPPTLAQLVTDPNDPNFNLELPPLLFTDLQLPPDDLNWQSLLIGSIFINLPDYTEDYYIPVLRVDEKLQIENNRFKGYEETPEEFLITLTKNRDQAQKDEDKWTGYTRRDLGISKDMSREDLAEIHLLDRYGRLVHNPLKKALEMRENYDKDIDRLKAIQGTKGEGIEILPVHAVFVSSENESLSVPLRLFVSHDGYGNFGILWDFTFPGMSIPYKYPFESFSDPELLFGFFSAIAFHYPKGKLFVQLEYKQNDWWGSEQGLTKVYEKTYSIDGASNSSNSFLSLLSIGLVIVGAVALIFGQPEIAIPAFKAAAYIAGGAAVINMAERIASGNFEFWSMATVMDVIDIAGALLTAGASAFKSVGSGLLMTERALNGAQLAIVVGAHSKEIIDAIESGDEEAIAKAIANAMVSGAVIFVIHNQSRFRRGDGADLPATAGKGAFDDTPPLASKPASSGHNIEIDPDGIKLCSPRPCSLLRRNYTTELAQNPALNQRLKAAEDLHLTNPEKAASEAQKIELELMDMRIVNTQAELLPARQRTAAYKAKRAAAGENQKGGPSKEVWNIYERIWILRRQRDFLNRRILEQARIVGVKAADGTLKPTKEISDTGRTLDYVEIEGTQVVGGDLKSASELIASIKGGVKKPGPMVGEFKEKSKIGGQHEVEETILQEARATNGKIVIEGKDVRTGQKVTIEVSSDDYRSHTVTYQDVLPN